MSTIQGPFKIWGQDGNVSGDIATIVDGIVYVNNIRQTFVPWTMVDQGDGTQALQPCMKPGVYTSVIDENGTELRVPVQCDPQPLTLADMLLYHAFQSQGALYQFPNGSPYVNFSIDTRTPEQWKSDYAAYLENAKPTAFDNIMEAVDIAALTYISGGGFAAGAGGVAADAGAAGADLGAGAVDVGTVGSGAELSAGTVDASPFTAPGVTDTASVYSAPEVTTSEPLQFSTQPVPEPAALPSYTEPVQLSGPGAPASIDYPPTVTEAGKQSLIEQLAAQTKNYAGAVATIKGLYTAVLGPKMVPGSGKTPAPVVYQMTGTPPASSGAGTDTGGLGTNLTPMVKQFAIPGLALLASIFLK